MGPTRVAQQRGTGHGDRRAGKGGRRASRGEERRGLRRAGSRRSGEGDWGFRRAGNGGGRGRRESRSGQRLGNIVVVLPPPWLRDMYKVHKDVVIK